MAAPGSSGHLKGKMSTASLAKSSQSGSKDVKNWKGYKKLKLIDLAEADFGERKFSNQYDRLVFILNRLQNKSMLCSMLKHTCSQIQELTQTMKAEIPKYRELLTGEVLKTEEGDDKASVDSVHISGEFVVKMFPFFEAILYKLLGLVSLIEFHEENSSAVTLMMIFTSTGLLPLIFKALKKLVSPLEEVELWKSKHKANISNKVLDIDKKELIQTLLETCKAMKEKGEDEELGIADDLDNLVSGISAAQEKAKKSADILTEFEPVFKKLSKIVANACDVELCEIAEDMLLVDKDDLVEVDDDFGDVYKSTCMVKGKPVYALSKYIAFRDSLSAISRRELQSELSQLMRLEHEHLTSFIGTCIKDDCLVLVWCYQKQTLADVLFNVDMKLKRLDTLTNRMLLNIATQILSALSFLHDSGVIHQNLTTRSVFVSKDRETVKVGDFLFVDGRREIRRLRDTEKKENKLVDFDTTYRAPETLKAFRSHSIPIDVFASDIYSFGMILFELVEKKKAHAGVALKKFNKRLLEKPFYRPNFSRENIVKLPKRIKNIIDRCWQQKPEVRPTATALLGEFTFQLSDPSEDLEPIEGEEVKKRDEAIQKWLPDVYIIEDE